VLRDAVADLDVGTTFMPNDRKLSARKLWIGFASQPDGAVIIDDGACRALTERGSSLLPAGVLDVRGDFDEEAIVEIIAAGGEVVGRGMALCDATTRRSIKGLLTTDIYPSVAHTVVNRDDLVVLSRRRVLLRSSGRRAD
jgi:glutamate 5-kinase